MKKSLLFLFVSLAFWATAQPPQNFSYQAAIRNSEGAALVDQSVTLRISLTNQSESQLFLVETHQTTSNAQGVVGIAIGSGTLVSGSFTAIPWGTNQIYIKTEVQTQQSGSFVDLGTTQLLSVPYALFAADGNQGAAGADGRTVLNGTSNPQSTLGTNGDFYINTTTNTLFGPKVGTNWGTGVLLVGPQGPQGTAGAMGATGTNGISVHWLGTFASHPGSPTLNQAYYNSTDKKSYVYNGTIWQIITQDGADAVSAVTGTGTAGKIAVWSAESVLTNIESFNIDPNVEVISDPAAGIDDPIFEVKNKDGKVVFGVYQSGVRIYVDDTETKAAKGGFAIGGLSNSTKVDEGIYFRVTPDSVRVLLRESTTKAAKGGFAIGGLSNSTKGVSQNLFFINSDSARIYINDATSKAAKGGFAIGGLSNSTKGDVEYMRISADSARIYINDDPAKAAKGGFAIGGLSNSTKAFGEEYLRITRDSARINVDNSGTKAAKGGFAIGGLSTGKSQTESFMFLTPENYFIGHESGSNILPSGLYNSTLGYQTGKALTTGKNNIFVGYLAGSSNSTGGNNVFLGNYAGFLNNASNNVFLGNESGRYNTSGTNNTFMGYYAGRANTTGSSNVFLGNESGTSNTSGSSNIAIGYNASANNKTGYNNISLGQASGYLGTDLHHNIFIGDSTGYATVSPNAYQNVFIGYAAGRNNNSNNNVYLGDLAGYSCVTGQNNIAIGSKAGYKNESSQNIFIGTEAGLNNTTGFFNIILGRWAGHSITTGSQQIIIGGGAGSSLTTGAENVLIGTNAGVMNDGNKNIFIGNSAGWSNTGSNNIIMGYKVGYSYFHTVSNRLIIDNSQVAIPLIWGEFDNRRLGINVIDPTATLDIGGTLRVRSIGSGAYSTAVSRTSDGTLTTSTSDIRLKENISTLSGSLAKVMALRGVNFTWKSEPGMGNRVGFIAQEVEKVVPELVFTNSEDGYMGVNYAEMTAVLVEAMKELKQENNDLRMRVEQLEKLFEQK